MKILLLSLLLVSPWSHSSQLPVGQCDSPNSFGARDLKLKATSRVATGPTSRAAGKGRRAFFPVNAISVTNKQVFVRTYGSDFFPVRLVRSKGRLEMKGARVLLYDVRIAENPFATAMRDYREDKMRLVVQRFDCNTSEMTLRILDDEVGIDEVIELVPVAKDSR